MTYTRALVTVLAVLAVIVSSAGPVLAADGDDATGTTIVTDGDELTLEAGPGRTITGQTDREPGTVLSIRARSAESQSPFLRTSEATVSESGTFEAQVDLTDVTPGTDFEVVVHHDGTELARANGTVVECERDCEPTPTPTPEDDDLEPSADAVDTDIVQISAMAQGASGGTVPVIVSVGDRETAAVSIGDESLNYRVNATVRDGDDDSIVSLELDTEAAGDDGKPTLTSRSDADEVTVHSESDLPDQEVLDPAGYPTAVFASERATGSPADVGRIILHAAEPPQDGTDATDTSTSSEEAGFGLNESVVQVRSGQRTTLAVNLDGAETASLAVGNSQPGLQVNATVEDGNDDGTVVVLMDTTAFGDDETPALQASAEGDAVTITDEHLADPPLEPRNYDLALYRGSDPGGNAADIGTLAVTEPLDTDEADRPPENNDTDDGNTLLLGGGVLAIGGVLAVVGLGVILGLFRD